MLAKVWTLAVAAAIAGALALPAPAAYAQSTSAPKPAATEPAAKPMAMHTKKRAHKMDCNDYAWESAAMKDCLAKGGSATSGDGMMKKKAAKKKKVAS
jgi:hypothetical protein